LLFDDGWNYQEIAHVLLLSDEAVKQHIQEYCNSQKLRPENGGSFSKLNEDQTLDLLQHLQQHTYLRVKEIVAYVEKVFGVAYTIAGMTDWLHAHGFSYKKPAVVPGKADKQTQEQWINEYQELRDSLSLDEAICFIDGVHPTHNTKLAYGWIQKVHVHGIINKSEFVNRIDHRSGLALIKIRHRSLNKLQDVCPGFL